MDQKEFSFGTEPYKLRRSDSLSTSIEASEAVDTTKLEELVYKTIKSFDTNGCIADDVLSIHSSYPYSSITARFSALERKGFITRLGDKRKGKAGRNQSVMTAIDRTQEEI